MRNTKIVCTMGPACNNKEILLKMIESGMNVARFNMSHGTHESLQELMNTVKEAIKESGKYVELLIDTKGPEVRVGTFKDGKVELTEGQTFNFYRKDVEGDENGVSLSLPKLVNLFFKDSTVIGKEILLDDGKLSMKVESVTPDMITCTVIKGGVLSNRKSINIPNYTINMPYVSQKDREDIEFGLRNGAHVVAASFVRSYEDVKTLRDYIDSIGYEYVEIISKIENQSGVDDIDRILEVSDGIMVARGDMGVEIPFIKLPEIQKTLIRKAVTAGKFVITATQMLDSMTNSPRPTRAEISDVANAVYDGTSAVMLSGESAMGMYPVESVQALNDICREAELNHESYTLEKLIQKSIQSGIYNFSFRENICLSAKEIAGRIGAKAIIVESATGRVARTVAHYRPECPIIAVVTSELVAKKLCLTWGVTAVLGDEKTTSDAITRQAMEKALSTGLVSKGDTVLVLSSNKVTPTASTDTLSIRIL